MLFSVYNRDKLNLEGLNMKEYKEVRNEAVMSAIPIVALVFLAAAGIAYIICRAVSNFYYKAKWSDYDECGI